MKKILAVAIASAFAAPAFAATANVDIYGRINTAVSFVTDEADGINAMQVTNFGSRLGFKGSEDLGGGLKGIWQIESSINTEEGNGGLSARNSFIGLSGGWGTVLAGKHDTPLKLVGRKVDLFGDTFGDSRNIMSSNYSSTFSDTRASNVVAYATPNMSGFSALAAYSTDLLGNNSLPDLEDLDAWNVNVEYANGPIYVGFAYGDGDAHEALDAEEQWRLAGSFTFGDFKIVGQYDVLGNYASLGDEDDITSWMVGGSYTMGAMTFKGNYMQADWNDEDRDQWAVGVDYAMSKRTTVYALYTAQSGDDGAVIGVGAGATDVVVGDDEDVGAFSVGVAHNF